jgi:hypothetical protein
VGTTGQVSFVGAFNPDSGLPACGLSDFNNTVISQYPLAPTAYKVTFNYQTGTKQA